MVNLSIGGGSFKGIAFVGVLEYLHKNKLIENLENLYGTSAGSIIGFLYLIGYEPFEIFKIIMSIDLGEYCNLDLTNVSTNYSILNDGLFIRLREIIKEKVNENITFEQLYIKTKISFNVFVTSLDSRNMECLNHQLHPNLEVMTAVKASSAIPLVFPPVFINDQYYVDGCLKSFSGINKKIIENDIKNNKVHFIIKLKDASKNSSFKSLSEYIVSILNCSLTNDKINYTKYTINLDLEKFNTKFNFNDIKSSDKILIYKLGIIQARETFKEYLSDVLIDTTNDNLLKYKETDKCTKEKLETLQEVKEPEETNKLNIDNKIDKETQTDIEK